MPGLGITTVTGEGTIALPTFEAVLELVWNVDMPLSVQQLSANPPHRLMHAGWVGVGYSGAGISGTAPTMSWFKYIEFQDEDVIPGLAYGVTQVFGDTIFYNLNTGVTMMIDVFW